ncbi:MAG: hypothetical protein ABSH16_06845 [Sedimentisphaerales bacterium]
MAKITKKITEQTSVNENDIRRLAKDWFARQSNDAKLTAVLLEEMSDADRGNDDLAAEILDGYRAELLHETNPKNADPDGFEGTLLCLLAKK